MKKITMTINQFMEIERGNKTLKEVTQENHIETSLEKVLSNNTFKSAFILATTAGIFIIEPTIALAAPIAIPASNLSSQTIGGPIDPTLLHAAVKNLACGATGFMLIHEVREALKVKNWKKVSLNTIKYGTMLCCICFADDTFEYLLNRLPEFNMTRVILTFTSIMEAVAASNSLDILRQI
jgi:hypothetical protein